MSHETVHLDCGFETAAENMDYDRSLHQKALAHPEKRYVRVYTWQTPGITIPEKRDIPSLLNGCDLSTRPTGGGVVFHVPGDLVICLVVPLTDSMFPKPLKEKLLVVSDWIAAGFAEQGIEANRKATETTERNLAFCKGYFSPSELYVGDEKVCGLTLKRYRHHIMVQGILHLKNTEAAFPNQTAFEGFFSQGLACDSERLKEQLLETF